MISDDRGARRLPMTTIRSASRTASSTGVRHHDDDLVSESPDHSATSSSCKAPRVSASSAPKGHRARARAVAREGTRYGSALLHAARDLPWFLVPVLPQPERA
jgi:hypothetical protein